MSDRREARTIKEALYLTVHGHSALSVEAIAEQLGISASYLYRSVTPDPDTDGPDASGCRFPLRQLIPLIRATGDYQALDFVERALGRVAVPMPPEEISTAELCKCSIQAAAKFGDLMCALDCVTDGCNTTDDAEWLINEGWAAMRAIMAVLIRFERNPRKLTMSAIGRPPKSKREGKP